MCFGPCLRFGACDLELARGLALAFGSLLEIGCRGLRNRPPARNISLASVCQGDLESYIPIAGRRSRGAAGRRNAQVQAIVLRLIGKKAQGRHIGGLAHPGGMGGPPTVFMRVRTGTAAHPCALEPTPLRPVHGPLPRRRRGIAQAFEAWVAGDALLVRSSLFFSTLQRAYRTW